MKIKIRRAISDDAVPIAKVHEESFMAAYEAFLPKKANPQLTEKNFILRWKNRLSKDKQFTYVAQMDKKIAGLITFCSQPDKSTAEILLLYIKPEFWRKGVGRRLILFALKTLRAKNIKKVTIWTLKNNPQSCAFYESIGAYSQGRERVMKNKSWMRGIKYCLDLNPPDK